MHAILTFRHLTFTKALFYINILTTLNYISYTHNNSGKRSRYLKAPSTRRQASPHQTQPPSHSHHLHLISLPLLPAELQVSVTGWQEYLGWLLPASQVVWTQETAPAQTRIRHSTFFSSLEC